LGRLLEGAPADIACTDNRIGCGLHHRRHQFVDLLVTELKTAWEDREVSAFDEAVKASLVKEGDHRRLVTGNGKQDTKTIGSAWLLRACHKGPRRRRTANKRDELSPFHVPPEKA
jgi:hypothetical protein